MRKSAFQRQLEEHDCALVVDAPDPAAVRGGLERLLRDADLRARLVRQALKTAEPFHISRVAAHFREVVQNGGPTPA